MPFGPGHWCEPLVTMHYVTPPEMSEIWRFEQQRNSTRVDLSPQTAPMLPDFKLATISELYFYFVEAHLFSTRDDWYNLSNDLIYQAPKAKADHGVKCKKPWDRLSDVEKAAHSSFDNCGRACTDDHECFQYAYYPGVCGLSHSIRRGHFNEPKNGKTYRSAWNVERIRKWTDEHPCTEPEWSNGLEISRLKG